MPNTDALLDGGGNVETPIRRATLALAALAAVAFFGCSDPNESSGRAQSGETSGSVSSQNGERQADGSNGHEASEASVLVVSSGDRLLRVPDLGSSQSEPSPSWVTSSWAADFEGQLFAFPEPDSSWVVRTFDGEVVSPPFDWETGLAWNLSGSMIVRGLDGGGVFVDDQRLQKQIVLKVRDTLASNSEDGSEFSAATGLGELSYGSGKSPWLDDQTLLLGTPDGQRIATVKGPVLELGARVTADIAFQSADPGTTLIFGMVDNVHDEYGTLDRGSGTFTPLGNLARDEGFVEPQVQWAPTGGLAAVLSEEEDEPAKVCRFTDSAPARCTEISGIDGQVGPAAAWKPDGSAVVVTATSPTGGTSGLFLVDAESGAAKRLTIEGCSPGCGPVAFSEDAQ